MSLPCTPAARRSAEEGKGTRSFGARVRSSSLSQAAFRRIHSSSVIVLLALTTLPISSANATGFFINQQSVPGIGRVDAGNSAIANDPSTIFYNPAGMTRLWSKKEIQAGARTKTSAGLFVIIPRSTVTNTGSTATTPGTLGIPTAYAGSNAKNPADPTPVFSLYAARPVIDDKLYFGLGVTTPFGLAVEYDRDWFGRYDTVEAQLTTIDIAPTIAYRFNNSFSLGFGVDIQYAKSKLTLAVPNTLNPGGPTVATDGFFDVSGDDWSAGFNVGALYAFSAATRVGIHYRSQMNHSISGNATTSGLTGLLAALNGQAKATAELSLPQIVSVGLAHQLNDEIQILADFNWFGWSSFDETRITFVNGAPDVVRQPNFRDTYAVSVGTEYAHTDTLTFRGGLKYDRTPTVDGFRDTSFPDADRLWIGLGASYLPTKRLTLDFAFAHAFFDDTSVALTRNYFGGTAAAGAININGDVSSRVSTIAIGLRYDF